MNDSNCHICSTNQGRLPLLLYELDIDHVLVDLGEVAGVVFEGPHSMTALISNDVDYGTGCPYPGPSPVTK